MNFRVSDSTASFDQTARINAQRGRLSVLQEQLTSGKRINRPSDDPYGAEAVINLRTSQTEIEQFQRNAVVVNQKLSASDDVLNTYETTLERVRTLVAKGLSDTNTPASREALATEIEALSGRVLSVANTKFGDEYLFGGTRQNAPPFDPTTAAAATTPNSAQYVQIEPGADAIASGVTAETIFSDANGTIFADLAQTVSALRGTGNATADQAALNNSIQRLTTYTGAAGFARTRIGANTNTTELAQDRLSNNSLTLEDRISNVETADFAATAIEFNEAGRALDATLQVVAKSRRSLFDFLG